MADLFKFRCYQCEKLLGVSASKIGAVVHCPRCGAELIVPAPEDHDAEPEPSEDAGVNLEGLGLRLEPDRLTSEQPPSRVDPDLPDPIAFLRNVAEAEEEPEAGPDPEGNPAEAPEGDMPPGLPEPPDPLRSPLVPGARRRGRSMRIESAGSRRDVVVPRTAAVAWSLFGLLGLAFAFASGLMIGHYLWR